MRPSEATGSNLRKEQQAEAKRLRWPRPSLLVLVGVVLGCAIPGQLYRVSPAIRGEIRGAEANDQPVDLRLNVMHRESPTLFEIQRLTLSRDSQEAEGKEGVRAFEFQPVDLEIAGHEYSKFYRVFLYYRAGTNDRVIWRGEFSRKSLAGPIELDCDLRRPARLGQPCQVRDPLRHVWLIDEGERTFDRLCSGCHRVDGAVASGGGAPGVIPAPDLTRITARRPAETDWAGIAEWIEGTSIPLEHGTRSMPVWGERLSEDYSRYPNPDELVGATLDPVIVYLRSIQR